MSIFIKEKECALGIDANPRAQPFYPADIGRFYKPRGNTIQEEHTKKTNEDTEKDSLQPAMLANVTNQWKTVSKPGSTHNIKYAPPTKTFNTNRYEPLQESNETLQEPEYDESKLQINHECQCK